MELKKLRLSLLVVFVMLIPNLVVAASSELAALDERIGSIKREMLELGKDMHIFERTIIHPDEERVSVFFSMDVGQFLDLESIRLKLDGEKVLERDLHHHEVTGLRQGAAVRLFVGSMRPGKHKLVAFLTGVDQRGRSTKRAVTHSFTKKNKPVFLELRVEDLEQRLNPNIEVHQW